MSHASLAATRQQRPRVWGAGGGERVQEACARMREVLGVEIYSSVRIRGTFQTVNKAFQKNLHCTCDVANIRAMLLPHAVAWQRLRHARPNPNVCVSSRSVAPLSFVFHAECTAHVPSWLPRSPSCELASDCFVAHLLPRQWHSLAACPRHVCVRAGPLLTSTRAMFVARQPIAEVVARLSRGRATTWLFL